MKKTFVVFLSLHVAFACAMHTKQEWQPYKTQHIACSNGNSINYNTVIGLSYNDEPICSTPRGSAVCIGTNETQTIPFSRGITRFVAVQHALLGIKNSEHVHIWNAALTKHVGSLVLPTIVHDITVCAADQNRAAVACGDATHAAYALDIETQKKVWRTDSGETCLYGKPAKISWNSEHILTHCYDGENLRTFCLYDVRTKDLLQTVLMHTKVHGAYPGMASPDDKYFIYGTETGIAILDLCKTDKSVATDFHTKVSHFNVMAVSNTQAVTHFVTDNKAPLVVFGYDGLEHTVHDTGSVHAECLYNPLQKTVATYHPASNARSIVVKHFSLDTK